MKASELVKAMTDAGAPMEAVLIALRAIEEGEDAIEQRRAADRERKRRQRDKGRDEDGTVTGLSQDTDVTVTDNPSLSPSPKENNSKPHPHTHPEKQTPRARKGHRLPDDWQPKPLTGEISEAVGSWPSGAIERELARFRDWAASATGPNAVKKDWDAAWRNWLRKADDEGRYPKNGTAIRNDHRGRDNRDGVAIALDRQLGFDDASRTSGRRDAGAGDGNRRSAVAALADLR